MKIVSQDANQLVAMDGAYGTLIGGVVVAVAGVATLGAGAVVKKPVVLGVGGVLLLIGVLLVLFHKKRTFTADKASGQATIAVQGIIGSKTIPLPIASIAKIQLVSELRTSTTQSSGQQSQGITIGGIGSRNGTTTTEETTRVLIVTRDGTTYDIADGSRNLSSFGMMSKVPNQAVAQAIATFLGVPFEASGAQTLGQTVQAAQQAVSSMINPAAEAPSVVVAPPSPVVDPVVSTPIESTSNIDKN